MGYSVAHLRKKIGFHKVLVIKKIFKIIIENQNKQVLEMILDLYKRTNKNGNLTGPQS